MPPTDIMAIPTTRLTDAEMASISSFNDVQKLLDSVGAKVEAVSEYGTGFKIADDVRKAQLVGEPFVILEANFSDGEYGRFVSCAIVTKHDDKLILNDGSTGVRDQLITIIQQRAEKGIKNPNMGIVAEGGLSVSNYYRNEETGEILKTKPEGKGWISARTYYLA